MSQTDAMPAESGKSRRTTLDGRGRGDWVLLTDLPSGDPRIAGAEAVKSALCLQDAVSVLFQKLDEIHEMLAEWASQYVARIAEVYTTVADGRLTFVVVQKELDYDVDLEDPLTGIDLKIARAFPGIPFSVLQLPRCSPESLQSFLSNRWVSHLEGLE